MLEKFYEIVYSELNKLDLNGQYYADWTADELFIIFYGDESEKDKIIKDLHQNNIFARPAWKCLNKNKF